MTTMNRQRSHLGRLLESLRLQRKLRPGQLAARLGTGNVSRLGSLIRTFELGEPITEHWLNKLIEELQPDLAELRRCLELDQAEAEWQLEQDRLAWEDWADQPIDPYLTVRYMPAAYGARAVPKAFCNSRDQAEGWSSRELSRFRAKGFLTWSRRERTWYDQHGVNPRRTPITFTQQPTGAWMQLHGSTQKFLLGPAGEIITRSYGLDQPGLAGANANPTH